MYLYLGRIFTLKLAGYMSDGGKQFSQPSEIAVHFGDLLRGAQTGLHELCNRKKHERLLVKDEFRLPRIFLK